MSLVGRLEDLALPDIFQILSLGRKSGCLVVTVDKGFAGIIFKNGLVTRCEGTFLGCSLGDELVEAGIIFAQDLERVRVRSTGSSTRSIGDTILQMGLVDGETLDHYARQRIEKIVYHLLQCESGDFRFELDAKEFSEAGLKLDGGVELSRGMSPEFLLMEGARVYDEERRSRGEMAPAEPRARRAPRPPQEQSLPEPKKEEQVRWESDDLWEDVPTKAEKRGEISSLMSLTAELRFPNNTSEITLLILRFASDIFQRGVLFMVGRGEIVGLGQFGLDVDNADQQIRKLKLRLSESPFFQERLRERFHYRGELARDGEVEKMISVLGGEWPEEVNVFPIVAEGRVVVLLYCDNMPSGQGLGSWEGLEVFSHQAGLAIEKALLERKIRKLQDEARGN